MSFQSKFFFYRIWHVVPGWRLLRKLIRAVSNLWKCSGHAHKRAKNRAVAEFQRLSLFSLLSLTYEHEISGGPHGCSENRPRPGSANENKLLGQAIGSPCKIRNAFFDHFGSNEQISLLRKHVLPSFPPREIPESSKSPKTL